MRRAAKREPPCGKPRKLSPEQVRAAREALDAGRPTMRELACQWDVSHMTVWRAGAYASYRHVD